MANPAIDIKLQLIENYKFEIDFGEFGQMVTDEHEPVGHGEGPGPSQLLATAVANCLAASLMFAIRKFKGDPGQVWARVSGDPERVDGRLRITNLAVELHLGQPAASIDKLERVLEQFEDFCVVTQSVRSGIDVAVTVLDSDGQVLNT
ncbi:MULTISPECIES: OsmC family protein [Pseudidiomarina]|uniref:OsmC-like protein n=2 Tax=Pseudidiomarina TaxID=2800384 RepID=A0A368V008_9GAMM|nr:MULTISPECIES: OsmC family protein [Pseudidiomarina]PWW14107.1 putative OsmC-like protein [Pseudidiomarina maritima]RBP91921.1 putative OsmC-like protein [Pseudidiomarina tainanensis]RCW33685.1 putative OsmC-like protein [Pseudidiomarina tainanensis]